MNTTLIPCGDCEVISHVGIIPGEAATENFSTIFKRAKNFGEERIVTVCSPYLTQIDVQYPEDQGERELGCVESEEPL